MISNNLDKAAVVDVWKREVGQISNRTFAHRLAASEVTSRFRNKLLLDKLIISIN